MHTPTTAGNTRDTATTSIYTGPTKILQHLQHMAIESLNDRAHVIDSMQHTSIAGYMLTPKIIKIMKPSTSTEDKKSVKMWRCITTAHNAPSAVLGSLLNKIANAVKVPFMDHCKTCSKKYHRSTGIEMRLYYRTDSTLGVLCDWHDKQITSMVKRM
jgi:hypothetical protein